MRFDLVWGEEKNLYPIFISYNQSIFFLESKMKLSSRKELLKESELTLKSIKKSLNEDSMIASLFNKMTKKVVDKIESAKLHKETLIAFMERMLEKMRNDLKKQNISDDTKSATSDILDEIENDIRAKIESNQLTNFKDVEKYALTKLLEQMKKSKR